MHVYFYTTQYTLLYCSAPTRNYWIFKGVEKYTTELREKSINMNRPVNDTNERT